MLSKKKCVISCVNVAKFATIWVTLSPVRSAQTVDFSKLSKDQVSLASAYLSGHMKKWDDLNSSEQIEFAGATQALGDWWQSDPEASIPQPGLDRVLTVDEIHGKIPSVPSPGQFKVDVTWANKSEESFKNAWQWGPHASQLHPGMHGYNENRAGDPFLGIVVLFCDDNPSKGQFHVGLRTVIGHYSPDNADIAKNYPEYCAWYQKIEGYAADCGQSSPPTASLRHKGRR